MNQDTIFEQLNIIFNEVFDRDDIAVNANTTADDVDGWDSLTHIKLITTIEKSLKIKFSRAELAKFENVSDMANAILSKSGVKS